MLESLKGSLYFLSMSLMLKSPDESRSPMQITQRIQKDILNIELKIKESSNDEDNIYDELMDMQFTSNKLNLKIEERLRENYEILLDCKKKMIPLEFLRGSLNDIFSLPERDTFIYDLMRYRLEKIDVDFDYLSEEVKSANGEETCEKLRESFNEIESELVMFPPPEGNVNERINFFTNKLTTCTAVVAKIKSYVDQDEKEFAIVKKVRFEKFVDCLDELNDSVQEFYEQMKDRSTSTAFFSINNEEEPFRDGIKLTFWNAPDLIENEDETFAQALSIILSVIR